MREFDEDFLDDEHRRFLRCPISEPMRVIIGDKEIHGVTSDISVGGAAIDLELPPDLKLSEGDAVAVFIEGAGQIPARVVRIVPDGIAVEFEIDPAEEKHLDAVIMRLLNALPEDD